MGTTSFLLPSSLALDRLKVLEYSYFTGGPDAMPFLTQLEVNANQLKLTKEEPDSGTFQAPWLVPSAGDLIISTSTIMERGESYNLELELARGKVNQLRNYVADWELGGLVITDLIKDQARQAAEEMGKAVASGRSTGTDSTAGKALNLACAGTELLMGEYAKQILAIRHQDNQPIESGLTARFSYPIAEHLSEPIKSAINHTQVNIPWGRIETSPGIYSWEEMDQLVEQCLRLNMEVIGGPIINMAPKALPGWIGSVSNSPAKLETAMVKFIDAMIRRYKGKIHRWIVCSGINKVSLTDFSDEILFRITCKLAEVAKIVNSSIETIVGISCPWGEFLSTQNRDFSPFTFADNLCRAGLNLAALDLEIAMGYPETGFYARDLMETSRLLDLFSYLGSPLTVTLCYPSEGQDGVNGGGHGPGGKTQEAQAKWAEQYIQLLLCKRYVQSIQWGEFQDHPGALWQFGGIVDAMGATKNSLKALARVRQEHLR